MRDITLEELLTAGCHFGHQVNRRNPKADEFIFEERAGVHIIDLAKTREGLIEAANFVKSVAANGGSLVLVGTKRQAKPIVEEEVRRAKQSGAGDLFYITSRWVGGMLTNFPEVSKNIKKLEDLNKFLNGSHEGYTKHEVLLFERERDKLRSLYEGIQGLTGAPTAIFIIDTHLETTAVKEAHKENVPLVGIVDTNADPGNVDYAISANDDAVGSIQLIMNYVIDAWIEGKTKEVKKTDSEKTNVEEKKEEKVKATKKTKKAVEESADNTAEIQDVDDNAKDEEDKTKPAKNVVETSVK